MNERESYFRTARSWAENDREGAARSRRTAWIVAGLAVGAAAFEAVAIAMLVPLKTVQPITLLVDRQTGYVQALDPVTPQRVSADAALTYAYIAQYVMAREGFDRATVQLDYRRAALWSTGRARSSYLSTMSADNPASPFRTYPAGTQISVRVKSVSRLEQGVGLVHFETQRIDRTGTTDAPRPWMAVVRYRYSAAPMAFSDRLINPLGFQVTGYRRDAEAPAVIIDDRAQPSDTGRRSPPLPSTASLEPPQATLAPVTTTPRHSVAPPPRRLVAQPPQRLAAQPSQNLAPPRAVSTADPERRGLPSNAIPFGSPLIPGSRNQSPSAAQP